MSVGKQFAYHSRGLAMLEQLQAVIQGEGKKVVRFVYEDETRIVEAEKINHCGNGNVVLVGKDFDRGMKYRSFSLNKMSNLGMAE